MKRLMLAVLLAGIAGCEQGVNEASQKSDAQKAVSEQSPEPKEVTPPEQMGQEETPPPQDEAVQEPHEPATTPGADAGDVTPDPTPTPTAEVPDGPSPYVLDHTMNRIDGTPQALDAYKGKVVLIVNTASKCGLTPQYEGLQTLYDAYKDEGLVVLGFPANQFNDQEPGTNAEITQFCTENYGVTFPMFEKTVVKGNGTCPLFQQLNALTAEPSWNFTKYLVDREGNIVDRIDPRTPPTDPQLVARIQSLLHG